MDVYASGGLGAGTMIALGIAYRIFLWANHRNFRSHCCGRTAEIGIDIDTPPQPELKIKIPKQEEQSPYEGHGKMDH